MFNRGSFFSCFQWKWSLAASAALGLVAGAQAQVFSDVHDFGGTTTVTSGATGLDGFNPTSAVTFDANGNMYGTTYYGGLYGTASANNSGTVWEITNTGVYKDLHDFGGNFTPTGGSTMVDGFSPAAGVTFDANGNMYGTTEGGGAYGAGMVWEISSAGVYSDLHDFGGTITNAEAASGLDGAYPEAGVTVDSFGNLYGTAYAGGPYGPSYENGEGMVWEITAEGAYVDLHDFGGLVNNATLGTQIGDGAYPLGGVTIDKNGNLFGTASAGGANVSTTALDGYGIVWEISNTGSYSDIHDFGGTVTNASGTSGPDGGGPACGVVINSSGALVGTTEAGGPYSTTERNGMVWELTLSGVYTDLHDFGGTTTNTTGTTGPDGYDPEAAVTIDSNGNIFGTTAYGGPYSDGNSLDGCGIVWKISSGGAYSDVADFGESVSYTSGVTGPDGANPTSAITFDAAGALYGTAIHGGQYNTDYDGDGIVWSIPLAVAGVTFDPGVVTGGTSSVGTVIIPTPAPKGGLIVHISSNSSVAQVPSGITIPAGSRVGTFKVVTSAVSALTVPTVTAKTSTFTYAVGVKVEPATLSHLAVVQSSFVGGTTDPGTVTLNGPAPAGGTVVSLTSSTSGIKVPATVTVPEGSTSATFAITASPVAGSLSGSVMAKLGSVSVPVQVLVVAPSLVKLQLSSGTVVGGSGVNLFARLTLNGPAPSAGETITLTSGNSKVASVPSTITIAGDAVEIDFPITAYAVKTSQKIEIKAVCGSVTQIVYLVVNPAN